MAALQQGTCGRSAVAQQRSAPRCGAQATALATSPHARALSRRAPSRLGGVATLRSQGAREGGALVRPRTRAIARAMAPEKVGESIVVPGSGEVKGVIHFIGGAFAGASPQVIYSLLLELLADSGYTVIATPFPVSFRHEETARRLYGNFLQTTAMLRADGRGYIVPETVPTFGVGHSMGSLLHLLIGSFIPEPTNSNVLISFNNKPVSDAIPVPLDPLSQAVNAARQTSIPGLEQQIDDAVAQAIKFAPPQLGLNVDQLRRDIKPLADQVGSVFGEVGDGTVEFTPTPSQSRAIISRQYSVPSTLLVGFMDDAIDETPEMSEVVRGRFPAGTVELSLPGTHVTPCGGDITWQVGSQITPLDAFAMGAKAISQVDIRRVTTRVVDWLDTQERIMVAGQLPAP